MKFKIGDRVKFKSYSPYIDWIRHNGEIATLTRITNSGRWAGKWANGETFGSLNENNIILVRGSKPVARRTFRLLKETPEIKKGALFQEKCDDGTQDFTLLDTSFAKYAWQSGNSNTDYPRDAVTKQPKWFVEVFQVLPEYATKEELKKYEAKRA